LGLIKNHGVKAGLAINPDIPVERLFPYLDQCDFVLLMSVFAGFGGQSFIEETYERVAKTKEEILRRGLKTQIEVDGGVSPKNARQLVECGADILVAGSAVFKSSDPQQTIELMRK
jgi:ribulose-phosphate 3-epimerase